MAKSPNPRSISGKLIASLVAEVSRKFTTLFAIKMSAMAILTAISTAYVPKTCPKNAPAAVINTAKCKPFLAKPANGNKSSTALGVPHRRNAITPSPTPIEYA